MKRLIRRKLRPRGGVRAVVRRAPAAGALEVRDAAKQRVGAHSELKIGGAHDPAEKSADAMADHVMRMPQGAEIHRKCNGCEEKDKTAHPKGDGGGSGSTTAASPTAAKAVASLGAGAPLAKAERAFFEPRFGADLSHVRVHEGAAADRAARAMNARAFALGSDIALAGGESRAGEQGRRLMAHELAHVMQSDSATVRRVSNCTGKTDETGIVSSHNVSGATISGPGNTAQISVGFSCKPRSLISEIVDSGNTVMKSEGFTIFDKTLTLDASGVWTTSWDGKKGYSKVGTYMAPDGSYTHRIKNVSYAPGKTKDIVAAGGGVLSTSPAITVGTGAAVSAGPAATLSRHLYDSAGKRIDANVETMAGAIHGEANGLADAEQRSIAWAIRNEMGKINSYSVSDAKSAFHFVTDTPTAADRTLAEDVLGKNMSADITGGAIKWYSPKSMPPNFGDCKPKGKADCAGGTVALASDPTKSSKAPDFHLHMTYVPIAGVTEWNFRFYKL